MATFALIHGAEDCGWAWHLVAEQLTARGHAVVAPDLPIEDESAGLAEYAAVVGDAVRALDRPFGEPLVVVGHSLGAFTAPLVAEQEKAGHLVLLAPVLPLPGETVHQWWQASGYEDAAREQSEADGGLTTNADPYVSFYNDVPRELADESMRRARTRGGAPIDQPLPLAVWPDVRTRVIGFRDDRFLPLAFVRSLAADRLGIEVEELPGGHCAPLSHAEDVATALLRDIA